jgi:hypothetical protein
VTHQLLPRWHPATLRAAWWTWRAIRAARSAYARGPATEVRLTPPPALPEGAVRGVRSVLARTGQRCLVTATVMQAWEGAHGRPRDLIIGVTRPGGGFLAHAWLDGDAHTHTHARAGHADPAGHAGQADDPDHAEPVDGYHELLRRSAP